MIDFLSSPFSLVSVGLGVLAIAIIGMVAWVLSIDRRTRGMVDSLEQERRKVAEMQVFLSRRGNDGARRAPRAPQPGAAVGARAAAGEAAAAARPQAASAAAGGPAAGQRMGGQPMTAPSADSRPMGRPAAASAAGYPVSGQPMSGQVAPMGQPGARSAVQAQPAAASAPRQEKQRGRGGRGAINVPYGVDQTGGAGYAGLDPRGEAQARAAQAARIRQQAAREAQMRAAQQAAQPANRGAAYTVAARGGVAAVPTQQPVSRPTSAAYTAAAGPSVQTPGGVRYVPSDPNYYPAGEGSQVRAHSAHSDEFAATVRTSDAHGQAGATPYDQFGDRPKSPVEGKRSMPWSSAGSEPRGRHAR